MTLVHTAEDHDAIERDIDRERRRMRETLGELGDRMSVGSVIDRVAHALGGAEAAGRRIGEAARRHPAPLLLIGAGLGWLAMSSGRENAEVSRRDARRHAFDARGRDEGDDEDDDEDEDEGRFDRVRRKTSEIAEDARRRGGEAASEAGERARAARIRAEAETAVARQRMRRGARRIGGAGRHAGNEASAFFERNPLAAGGLAFAAGALLGAMTPNTRFEDEAFGDVAETVRNGAENAARDAADRAKRAGAAAADAAADRAADVADRVEKTSEKAGAAVADAGAQVAGVAKEELGRGRDGRA